ncbi:hypothetical protein HanRHA438_Chr06g0280781 [Helianthus annuus]|uniref:Secreted protein n=1 Tax=Helianthus annuus TaxID=4232 RepID=A0A251UJ40_HELAN|nr:hypothetical protein HanXRQr2_Chr06g0271791 [Helianthus annuus]KAJ0561420.1 hypothetical protein HanHA300_Chr06g0222701 [Helianthus annuus]KAJ0574478.1 hypothetical protein HanHA89_Chr06g0238591 [Helianthus annuus]KAJ0738811.1 hypothetical protein HanLR1_Chr06g0222511 [Helianthus annuus]KAJ0741686.1 hypothetical protein HanOQP8_Chr06g0230861 [Helianthus annuus]
MNSVLFAWFLLIYLFGRSSPIQTRVFHLYIFHLYIFVLLSLKKREQGLVEVGPPGGGVMAEPRRWPVSLNLRESEGWQKRGRPWWRSHDGGRFL